MTPPPSPQPKQWKNSREGFTLNDGVFSSWKGQSPFIEPPPAFLRVTYWDTTSSMGAFSRTSAMLSSRIRPATSPILRRCSVVARHDVHRLLAGRDAVQLVADQAVGARPHRAARATDVRGDQQPGASQSGLSAGSGSGSTTSTAARIRAASQRGDQGVGVDDRAASHVDQQRALLHRARNDASTRPRDSSVSGSTSTTTSASGSSVGQLARSHAPRPGPTARPGPRSTRTAPAGPRLRPRSRRTRPAARSCRPAPGASRASTRAGPAPARTPARRAATPGSA